MTITIEVPAALREQIERDAEREGRPMTEVALARLADWYGVPSLEEEPDPEVVEAIRRGLDDVAAGRTVSVDDYRREMEARHAAARAARSKTAG